MQLAEAVEALLILNFAMTCGLIVAVQGLAKKRSDATLRRLFVHYLYTKAEMLSRTGEALAVAEKRDERSIVLGAAAAIREVTKEIEVVFDCKIPRQ